MAQETMTRLFTFKYIVRAIGKEAETTEVTRHLDIGDVVVIDGELMRIMEDPSEDGGVIWVSYLDPSKGDTQYMKHENDVEENKAHEYNEWW